MLLPVTVPYLLLKASADRLPLADNTCRLVLATPPYLGARALRRHEYGARQPAEYERSLARFFSEAGRVVEPGGTIVLHTNHPAVFRTGNRKSIVFTVHRKRRRKEKEQLEALEPVRFPTRHIYLRGFSWPALPVWVYRALVERYSRQGDKVLHVFSGCGNGGLAALECGRNVVLVDLHYHGMVRRRLRRKLAPAPTKAAGRPR